MAQNDKIVDANSSQADTSHADSPPVYTPRSTTPKTSIHPPLTPRSTTGEAIPEQVHAPAAPFSIDLLQIGPEPANVICPRCHYGVRTSFRNRVGTHAG